MTLATSKPPIEPVYAADSYSDGFGLMERWTDHRGAIGGLWTRFPELLAAGLPIILKEPSERGLGRKVAALPAVVRESIAFLRQASPAANRLPRCDAVLYYSSAKPSFQPPTEALGARLVARGFKCAVIQGTESMDVWKKDPAAPHGIRVSRIDDYSPRTRRAEGRVHAVRLLAGSFVLAGLLLALSLVRSRRMLRVFGENPLGCWRELLMSSVRLGLCRKLQREMNPRFLMVNNERVPMGAELVLTGRSRDLHTVLFNSELPFVVLPVASNGSNRRSDSRVGGVLVDSAALQPIISKEVWVWNATVADAMKLAGAGGQSPRFSLTGSGEVSLAVDRSGKTIDTPSPLLGRVREKFVFVFLVDYSPSLLRKTDGLAAVAHGWVAEAAARMPNWHFVVKTRNYHHQVTLPGEDRMRGLANLTISRGDISYEDFLAWDRVAAVGGYSSTGLYVAAGAGKISCRFLALENQARIPVLDEVTVPIRSSDDLVQVLSRVREPSGHGGGSIPDDRYFPCRGATLDRMEALALESLTGTPGRENS